MNFNQSFLLHFILLFFVYWNCIKVSATDSNRYRVLKGEIICDEPLWLVFAYQGNGNQHLDSVLLKKGSNYIEFKGLGASYWDEDCYTLSCKKKIVQFWFFFTNDTITVNIDLTKPDFRKRDKRKMFFGSPATIEFYDQEKVAVSIYRKRIALKEERDSLLFYNPESLRINDLNKKMDSLINVVENYYIKCVLNSKYSCNVGFTLVFLTSNKNDLNPYVWLADSAEKRFPKSCWIKEVTGSIRAKAKKYNNVANGGASSNFELKDAGNMVVRLLDYRGSYILLDFWASWCRPCINEMPKTIEIQKKYGGKGLKVITISIDKDKQAWLKAIEKHQMQNLVNLHDEKGDAAKAYHVSYVPLTILIDPKGEIIGSNLHGEELEIKLGEIYK